MTIFSAVMPINDRPPCTSCAPGPDVPDWPEQNPDSPPEDPATNPDVPPRSGPPAWPSIILRIEIADSQPFGADFYARLVRPLLGGFAGNVGPPNMPSKLNRPPPTAIKAASPPMIATFFINWIDCIGWSATGKSQNR
jgi:hypothetical protein